MNIWNCEKIKKNPTLASNFNPTDLLANDQILVILVQIAIFWLYK